MPVEDCECIAGVPPSEKLAALYCVFKTIADGGSAGGGDVVAPLASIDIADVANIDSFTRAGAAGFSGNGETAFQREAAADVLRSSHYVGGVQCVILEDSPTACALVAPGVPSVTPGELEFSATYTAIAVTASLLKYQYQIDSDGWVDNGTNLTLTDVAATAGDHTLSVRAVSTSGVAGATATSASFEVSAPALTALIDERFEGAGYEEGSATEYGETAQVNPDFSTTGLSMEGSSCLNITGHSSESGVTFDFTAKDEVWFYALFRYQFAVGGVETVFALQNGATEVAQFQLKSTGDLRARMPGSGELADTTDTTAVDTTYHIKGRYTKVSGANAVVSIEFSATGSFTGSGNKFATFTTGTETAQVNRIKLRAPAFNLWPKFDKLVVYDGDFGNAPA